MEGNGYVQQSNNGEYTDQSGNEGKVLFGNMGEIG